jgi:hypothetical protein
MMSVYDEPVSGIVKVLSLHVTDFPNAADPSFYRYQGSRVAVLSWRRGRAARPQALEGTLPWFLYGFGIVAVARDYLDFRWAWPFLYPISEDRASKLLKWPITRMVAASSHSRWIKTGLAIIAVDIAVLGMLGFWDFPRWTAVCG